MSRKIGFIGVGNMGTAIIRGLASRDIEIHGIDLNTARLDELHEELGLVVETNAAEMAGKCDYVLLAVKPQHAEPVVREIAPELNDSKCLISICAGLTSQQFREWTGNACPVVRVMPTTPALVGEGVFAVCLDDTALTDDMKTSIPELFKGIGTVHELSEKLFDAYTGVIGSGPAYVFYFMEALIEAGVSLGLTRPQSVDMVKGLFLGSAKLAAESDHSVAELREMVSSPGGTTIRGLMHFDRNAVRGTIIDGAIEAYLRSVELGE